MRLALVLLYAFILLFCSAVLFADELGFSPKPVYKNIGYVKNSNGRKLVSEAEYHGLMDVEYEAVVSVLSDLEGSDELFPNVVECEITAPGGRGGTERRIKASYEILGLGRSYNYVETVSVPENGTQRFRQESWLVESLDDELSDYHGSWVVERCNDGSVKVNLYSYFEYKNPFFMQELILESFTDSQIRQMFKHVEEAAKALN